MTDTLVLLRGLARGCHHWGGFAGQLQQALPQARVVTPDLAGNGERHGERSPVHVTAAVADLRRCLLEQQIAPPYRLLGLSLGGMLALQWLNDYPAEVDSAVVINSSHAGLSRWYWRLRPAAAARLLLAASLPPPASERLILPLVMNRGLPAGWLQQCIRLAQAQPVGAANVLRQVRLARSFAGDLSIAPHKVLLLASRADRLAAARCSERLASRYHFALALHASAGHELTMDAPDWVIEQALSFWYKAPA